MLEIVSKRYTLNLGEHIAAPSGGATGRASNTVTLSADTVGQFRTLGQINSKSVRFLVDTGAASVALPASAAQNIGFDYTERQRGFAATATGVMPTYRVMLDAALMGMSFLNCLKLQRESVQMTLTKRL